MFRGYYIILNRFFESLGGIYNSIVFRGHLEKIQYTGQWNLDPFYYASLDYSEETWNRRWGIFYLRTNIPRIFRRDLKSRR